MPDNFSQPERGIRVSHGQCPHCDNFLVRVETGEINEEEGPGLALIDVKEEIVYPKGASRPLDSEVPEPYAGEFREASTIQNMSPKASAALSRRVLQNVLREEFEIKHRSLAQEIDDFIKLKGVPSHLSGAVDAVRNIGNFAAHPSKNSDTGTIVEVEPGEAEWLLDVLDALFDFTFVQPKRLEERKRKLNEKLGEIGKPPMKD